MLDTIRTTETLGATPDHPVELNYADSAAWLKQELRRRFPATTFRVRGSRGTGAGYSYIAWTDGPSVRAVQEVTGQVEGTTFDGMTDSTTSHETRAQWCPKRQQWVRPWLRGIMENRTWSEAFLARVAEAVSKRYNAPIPPRDQWRTASPFANAWSQQDTWEAIVARAASDRTALR